MMTLTTSMQSRLESYFSEYRNNIIGAAQTFASPYGEQQLIYADWTASGRAYGPIERYLQQEILPFLGNTHTGTTVTGSRMSGAYEAARQVIKQHVNAHVDDILLFCGNGMTAAVNKLQRILGMRMPERITDYMEALPAVDEIKRPVVFVTHMEHHSNHLSWLETIATVVIIGADQNGNVDLDHFETLLRQFSHRPNKIAAVTACSNVTGIHTPYHEIAARIHAHGGWCFVDFACAAPYCHIDMHPQVNDAQLDAIYFSSHKFLGGPGAPGILIFNRSLYRNEIPDHPGGGTVTYSNPWGGHEYARDIEQREDGGTPPFLQAIRAAMCIRLKEQMGVANILQREAELLDIIFSRLSKIVGVKILAADVKQRLGIVSFLVTGVHYNLIVRLLNDRFGIQTRGGCSCAGTYGHTLLQVDEQQSHTILQAIRAGDLSCKPGWVRLSVHPTMTNAEVIFIMDAIEATIDNIAVWQEDYYYDRETNEYCFKGVGGERRWEECFEVGTWF